MKHFKYLLAERFCPSDFDFEYNGHCYFHSGNKKDYSAASQVMTTLSFLILS